MKTKKYTTAADLLMDESFLAWYHQTAPHAIQYWNDWMTACPENGHLATKAIGLLQLIQSIEKEVPDEQVAAATTRLLKAIKRQQ